MTFSQLPAISDILSNNFQGSIPSFLHSRPWYSLRGHILDTDNKEVYPISMYFFHKLVATRILFVAYQKLYFGSTQRALLNSIDSTLSSFIHRDDTHTNAWRSSSKAVLLQMKPIIFLLKKCFCTPICRRIEYCPLSEMQKLDNCWEGRWVHQKICI